MDVEGMISHLKDLDQEELARLDEAVKRQLREIGGRGTPVSDVLDYRPHADGYLQLEVRRYIRKDGSVKERGPYWYFRYHESGKQRTLYLGRTDDPEEELARRRTGSRNAT